MYNIIKTFREELPPFKFIGLKYGDEDRIDGNFSNKWNLWFEKQLFNPLENLSDDSFKAIYPEHDSYIGMMRFKEGEPFEYWIGKLIPKDISTPKGYDEVIFNTYTLGVSLIKGITAEIFGKEEFCAKKLHEEGMELFYNKDGSLWFFERYVHPRFTTPDESNEVILDICHFIK